MTNHKNVYEYDGAFKCHDCGARWGAFPGNPKEPEICKTNKRDKALKLISDLHSNLSYVLDGGDEDDIFNGTIRDACEFVSKMALLNVPSDEVAK